MKKLLFLLLILVVGGLISYGSYRKGYSIAVSKAAAEYDAEHGNDGNDDVAVKHSVSWMLGYNSGRVRGMSEATIDDMDRFGNKLAQIVVETNNPNLGARLIMDGLMAPSQVQTAESQYNQQHPGKAR